MTTYQDDKTWVASKQLAKLSGNKDNWLAVVTYYNLSKGRHVKMYALDKNDGYYRVIGNTDNGNTILLKDGKQSLVSSDLVEGYRKFFECSDAVLPLRQLKTLEPIKGEKHIYYNE